MAQRENLKKIIEEQANKIETYKKKLKDVVEAYKDLSKEKLALEASINALTSDNHVSAEKSQSDQAGGPQPEEKDISGQELNPDNEVEKSADTAMTDDSQQRLNILTNTLKTLTQQKNKLEANWVSERKQSKLDLQKKEEELEEVCKKLHETKEEVNQWRSKLRTQQQEHSRQQEDCSLVIKELQAVLSNHKMTNQQLLMQVEEMKMGGEEQERSWTQRVAGLQERERRLSEELAAVKEQVAKQAQNQEDPVQVAQLKRQIAELQERRSREAREEAVKALEMKARQQDVSMKHEERVNGMESRLLHMSQVLSEVESNKSQLCDTIQKLTHKNAQLDFELSTLSSTLHSPDLDKLLAELDSDQLYDKARFIVATLKANNYDGGLLYDLLDADVHAQCKERLQEAQEEFERYKLRAQSVLKSKCKENSAEQESLKLKSHISELKDKVMNLQAKMEVKEEEMRSKEEHFNMLIKNMQSKHLSEMDKAGASNRQKVVNIELELTRQRERTVSMLAEKDQEVAELRCRLVSFEGNKVLSNEVGASSVVADETSMTLQQLLSSRAKEQLGGSEHLLHYSQEKAMLEVQLSGLRKDKYRLENELKECRMECVTQKGLLEEELVVLKEEIRKGDRSAKRESANMEYLKNIVFKYMVASSNSSKQLIAKAISTILQFSPSEKKALYSKHGWSAFT